VKTFVIAVVASITSWFATVPFIGQPDPVPLLVFAIVIVVGWHMFDKKASR
jgi:hypothetical protein